MWNSGRLVISRLIFLSNILLVSFALCLFEKGWKLPNTLILLISTASKDLILCFFFVFLLNHKKNKQEKKGKQTQVHTPPGIRPKAWPAWPAAGQKQPVRRWGSWWWSAGHVLETPPRTPAHYQTPRRRSGGLTAPHRSCMVESRVKQSWCSWWKSAKRKRMWGRIWGSTRGHWWHRQRNYVQGKREGRRGRRCRLTCWVKSSCSSEHGQAEN